MHPKSSNSLDHELIPLTRSSTNSDDSNENIFLISNSPSHKNSNSSPIIFRSLSSIKKLTQSLSPQASNYISIPLSDELKNSPKANQIKTDTVLNQIKPSDEDQTERRGSIYQENGVLNGNNHNKKHMIGTLQLVGITFFAVAGGPYGLEESIGAAGFLPVIIGLLLFPFLWAMPLAVMTAELSTMIPESGGHIIWINEAFGPFVSFLNSFSSFLCSAFDNALYPVLFVDYIKSLLSPTSVCENNTFHLSFILQLFIKITTILSVLFLNFAGVDIVGSASYLFTILVLSPFIIFFIIGSFKFNFKFLNFPTKKKKDWAQYFAIMLWNFSGFDSAGTCASDVADPGVVYPRALGISVALISTSYFLPAVMGMSFLPDVNLWCDGTFVVVSDMIGGKYLKAWMAVCGSLSAFGILLTLLMTSSKLVYGMSCVGQLPACFAQLDEKTNCPKNALILNAIITFILSFFDFASLAQIDMMFYGFSTILKILALVYFRFFQSQKTRPFQIPLGKYSLTVASLIPLGICVLMICLCDFVTLSIGVLSLLIAISYYFIFGVSSNRRLETNNDNMQSSTLHREREILNCTKSNDDDIRADSPFIPHSTSIHGECESNGRELHDVNSLGNCTGQHHEVCNDGDPCDHVGFVVSNELDSEFSCFVDSKENLDENVHRSSGLGYGKESNDHVSVEAHKGDSILGIKGNTPLECEYLNSAGHAQ